jgi:hypothetical protein
MREQILLTAFGLLCIIVGGIDELRMYIMHFENPTMIPLTTNPAPLALGFGIIFFAYVIGYVIDSKKDKDV